ncbi:tyrosine-type recombinase/integrase [Leptolyngbya sp. FACHB-711]|uniref:tyrosine-type recombinase/integrase n=1 Tax=unclassified Leptolyngbya TaxID=2650499 RepID=UPI001683A75E|nr:tyrosine-type recombinase/integrase [Leptolyngbya sp. FACHB-711]MBD1853312.1 tyrosine-type recombinase/integrase [Cyanobacteria bacterium FACHB-502]MBD2024979.1 tyrosine-type recombinase/integrase [Leptolyngbya sp. FACHB-711]
MPDSPTDPVSPLAIVSIEGGKKQEPRRSEPPDLRHWQIEEFLRQTGKAENTQRTYRGQLIRFAAWCDKSWLDVTPSDIGKYRRELKSKGLKPTSINHVLNTLRSFYGWLRRSNGYPMNQPLPTDAIDLERQEEPQADHLETEDLSQLWEALNFDDATRVRDRAIVAVLSHGLRASEASALNMEHWNGRILKVRRSKGQNVSEVPLSREARSHLEAYLEWRREQGGVFEPLSESPMFLAQDPKNKGKRLGYKGLHKMVRKLGAVAGVEDINPHRFRHTFGTEVTRRGVDPLFGKELMGIKSDRVFQRYTKGVFKQAAAEAYLKAIGEADSE